MVKILSASCLRVIYTAVFDSIKNFGPFFGYYFFNVLLVMLQILHVYWFCLILRMLSSFLRKGQVWKPDWVSSQDSSMAQSSSQCSEIWPHLFSQMKEDIRSDVEEPDSSDDEAVSEGPQLKNGMARGTRAAITNGPRSRAAACLTNGHTRAT